MVYRSHVESRRDWGIGAGKEQNNDNHSFRAPITIRSSTVVVPRPPMQYVPELRWVLRFVSCFVLQLNIE